VHEQGVVHRDIKPDNILLDTNNIPKITDFNVSAMVGRGRPNQVEKVEGTIYFYAPELCEIENEECLKFDAFPLDVWALGITLYCLVYLEVPFKSSGEMSNLNIIKQISKGVIKLPETRKISDGLQALIMKLLNINPTSRPKVKELMEDEWLNQGREPLSIIHKTELIKVTEEEIEQSLDFFLSDAKSRNYDLDIKEKKMLLSASSIGKKSIRSINNTISSNKAIGKLNSTIQQSNKLINKSSSPMKLSDSNYFYSHQQSMRMINKPRITEDEFFDN